MNNIINKFLEICSRANSYIMLSRSCIFIFSLFSFFGSLIGLSYYAWYHIHNPVAQYDIDGWGHLVCKMIDAGESWRLLPDAVYLWRGFLVPFIFGLSYCIFNIPESVQILNVFTQASVSMILTYYFSNSYRNPLLGFSIALIWAIWPPFSSYYGYYFSEPLCGLIYILLWIVSVEFLKKPEKLYGIMLGALLALSIHVRASSVLIVFFFFVCLFTLWRKKILPFLPLIVIAFSVVYFPWPIRNYIVTGHFIPLTVGGGYVLHQGSFLSGDDCLLTLRTIPEFQEREKKAETMDLIARDKYFKKLAIEQMKADPLGQIKLTIKKMLRFWYYIPAYEWLPTVKTLLVMTPLLILALIGSIKKFDDTAVQLILLMIFGLWILSGITHSELRYHFPVFPLLLFLSYQGVSYIYNTAFIRKREAKNNA